MLGEMYNENIENLIKKQKITANISLVNAQVLLVTKIFFFYDININTVQLESFSVDKG